MIQLQYLAMIQIIFRIALFLCGFLIAIYIPITAKMLIPRAVGYLDADGEFFLTRWAMMAPSAAVFAGVVFAHFVRRLFSKRSQILIQLFAIAIGAFLLFVVDPFETMRYWSGPSQEYPRISLSLFIIRVFGPMFFVISSSAVLLQYWYSRIGGSQAADPYFLYGDFSFGSLTGLFLYPLYLEWLYPLQTQSTMWKICFGMLMMLVAVCSWWAVRIPQHSADDSVPVNAGTRIRWVVFAMLPVVFGSILFAVWPEEISFVDGVFLLAVTRFSMVFAFRRRSTTWTAFLFGLVIYLSPFACYLWLFREFLDSASVLIFGTALFCFWFVCYRVLFRIRPSAENLTEFYVFVAIGRCGQL